MQWVLEMRTNTGWDMVYIPENEEVREWVKNFLHRMSPEDQARVWEVFLTLLDDRCNEVECYRIDYDFTKTDRWGYFPMEPLKYN